MPREVQTSSELKNQQEIDGFLSEQHPEILKLRRRLFFDAAFL
jgi:hypothetical protein